MMTEVVLGDTLTAKLDAMSLTFAALSDWERAYVSDTRGLTPEASAQYASCLEKCVDAASAWKAAEFKQSELIAYMMSLPPDIALRPAVKEALAAQDPEAHVRTVADDLRAPRIAGLDRGVGSMVELGASLVAGREVQPSLAIEGDEPLTEVVQLLEMDLEQIRNIRVLFGEAFQSIRDGQADCASGTMYERLNYAIHVDRELYPVSKASAKLRTAIANWIAYFENYGSYIVQSLMDARDEGTYPEARRLLNAG